MFHHISKHIVKHPQIDSQKYMATNDDSGTSNENTMILSIRLIRSFEHRNIRHVTLRSIDSSGQMTGSELKQRILTSS